MVKRDPPAGELAVRRGPAVHLRVLADHLQAAGTVQRQALGWVDGLGPWAQRSWPSPALQPGAAVTPTCVLSLFGSTADVSEGGPLLKHVIQGHEKILNDSSKNLSVDVTCSRQCDPQ